MKANIKATVIEQPGKLGKMKARALAAALTEIYYGDPEFAAEVDRRVAELHKKGDEHHD